MKKKSDFHYYSGAVDRKYSIDSHNDVQCDGRF